MQTFKKRISTGLCVATLMLGFSTPSHAQVFESMAAFLSTASPAALLAAGIVTVTIAGAVYDVVENDDGTAVIVLPPTTTVTTTTSTAN